MAKLEKWPKKHPMAPCRPCPSPGKSRKERRVPVIWRLSRSHLSGETRNLTKNAPCKHNIPIANIKVSITCSMICLFDGYHPHICPSFSFLPSQAVVQHQTRGKLGFCLPQSIGFLEAVLERKLTIAYDWTTKFKKDYSNGNHPQFGAKHMCTLIYCNYIDTNCLKPRPGEKLQANNERKKT